MVSARRAAPTDAGLISGTGALLGSDQMERLARDLHKMGAAGRRRLTERFARIGQPLLAEARRNAGWSTRIPAAMSVKGTANQGSGRIGIQLRVSVAQAPHARAYEGLSQQGSDAYFRHPVYGGDTWVSQKTRPYAVRALVAQGPRAREAILAAYEDAAREAGFR
jgi:hypothetical protein